MSAKGQRCEQPASGPTKWGSTARASRRKEADTRPYIKLSGAMRPPLPRRSLLLGGKARSAKEAVQ